MIRHFALVLGLLAMFGTFQTVAAKSLEDVLKEKGVITEEDYKEIVKSRQVQYRSGSGTTLTSPDGKNTFRIGGQMQPQFDYVDSDEGDNNSAFEIKRIKLWFEGRAFLKDLTYKLQIRISNLQGSGTKNGGLMEETRLGYRFRDDLQVLVGQTKVRFGRQAILSSKVMHMVDKSQVTKAFFPTYDTGVMLHGAIADGLLYYNAAVFGGAGQNTWSKNNNRVAWNARLAVNPLGNMKYTEGGLEFSEKPLVSFAANYYQNKLNDKDMTYGSANHIGFLKSKDGWFAISNSLPGAEKITGETVKLDMYGFDAAFHWKRFWIQAEYMVGEAEGQDSGNELKAEGFYVQSSFFVIPKKLSLGYRYSQFDPNKDVSNDKWIENTAAISWYVKGHSLKVQADYTNIHKEAILAKSSDDIDDQRLRLQVQLLY